VTTESEHRIQNYYENILKIQFCLCCLVWLEKDWEIRRLSWFKKTITINY